MSPYYITKYALTTGIFSRDTDEEPRNGVLVFYVNNHMQIYHGEGLDWHRTPEAALQRAEDMRAAKLKSLGKTIAKLKALKFEVPA